MQFEVDMMAPGVERIIGADAAMYGAREGGQCDLRAYPVEADGSVGACRVLQVFGAGERGIEGMCLDAAGNIVACGGCLYRAQGLGRHGLRVAGS